MLVIVIFVLVVCLRFDVYLFKLEMIAQSNQPIRIQLEMVQEGEQLKSLCTICMLVPSIISSEVLDAQKCCRCDQTAFTVLINLQNIKAEQVNVNCRHVLTFFCLHGRAVIQDTVQTFLRLFPLRIDEIMLFDPPDGIFCCYSSTKTE